MKEKSNLPWNEKLTKKALPKVKHIDKQFSDIEANSDMLVATPKIFEEYLNRIPKGQFIDTKQIRKDLAKKFKADATCPVTTGLFLRIVAESAFEKFQNGTKPSQLTPFWRAISPNSTLAKKLSFGKEFLIEMQKKEGIEF
ncbi:hypothetical protein EHQ46_01255 [Leptospira yanagawae]|uniref:Uncharacterized protein n=1 Tax=Leptospira yanagawae TaxID=293069 RepID=A0ABY2M3M5_9LEPT|nr:hypothetical protein [Leptospira yanagawae]TGL23784.1 hypothetical protein EHQ46_01255 [Leptospira yanagawae]